MRVVLYSRPGCHLCDVAREVIVAERGRTAVRRSRRSTSRATTRLELEYGIRIPVVTIDGEERFEIEVDRRSSLAIVRGAEAARRRTACELVNRRVRPARLRTHAAGDARRDAGSARSPRRPSGGCPSTCVPWSRSAESGATTVSSEELAEAAGVNSAKVRKDLSHLGSYGTRGVGYDVAYLIHQIRRELGLTQDWPIVIAGIGNLGHALANYRGFAERGFRVAALVDVDPAKVGERVGELTIRHVDELPELVRSSTSRSA